jgi:hypothetical protein
MLERDYGAFVVFCSQANWGGLEHEVRSSVEMTFSRVAAGCAVFALLLLSGCAATSGSDGSPDQSRRGDGQRLYIPGSPNPVIDCC